MREKQEANYMNSNNKNWLYNLLADNKPLPKGTRIKTTAGGAYTGETHELTDNALESANRLPNHLSNYVPFWILGWTDLHQDLISPNIEKATKS